jgi:hypothetical protein
VEDQPDPVAVLDRGASPSGWHRPRRHSPETVTSPAYIGKEAISPLPNRGWGHAGSRMGATSHGRPSSYLPPFF